MSEPIKTGDLLEIELDTIGKKCRAAVMGVDIPGLTGIAITAKVGEVTRLSLDAFYPWPRVMGPDRQALRQTFEGYFISREDMEAFNAWRAQRKGKTA